MIGSVKRILYRLFCDRSGNVALLFGLAAIPVIVGAGIAMDTARAYMVKTRLGAALDAAALAVGSQTNQPEATLTAELKSYFYNNYCKSVAAGVTVISCSSTVANESNINVEATTDITGATVDYRATARVPTTFMQLVGISQLTVSVATQTTKFPGMEIAVVLDNTGSMLCGAAASASSGYSNCSSGVLSKRHELQQRGEQKPHLHSYSRSEAIRENFERCNHRPAVDICVDHSLFNNGQRGDVFV